MSPWRAQPLPAAPGGRPMLAGALVAAAYGVAVHLPLGEGWVVAAAAVLAALAFPAFAIPLCVVASMVQDAPGLHPTPALAAAVGCGTAHVLRGGARAVAASSTALRATLAFALLAVLVGTLASLAGMLGFGHEQSAARPALGVALADLAMPIVGAAIGASAAADPGVARRMAGAALAGLAMMAVRVAVQVQLGPTAGFSEQGRDAIASVLQLSGNAPDGVIRYVGSMLTPNAMSMLAVFAAVLAWPSARRGGLPAAMLLGGAAVAAALLAGSKSSLVVAGAAALSFMLAAAPRRTLAIAGTLATAAAVFLLMDDGTRWEQVAARLRIDAVGSAITARSEAWDACERGLHASDAVVGMGLSHWPVFFEREIGEYMADPHTAVFSYPWTYGIAGPVALLVAVAALARVAFRGGAARAPAIVLLATLLLRDLVAIPLLIGATVLTLQLWACMALVLARDQR